MDEFVCYSVKLLPDGIEALVELHMAVLGARRTLSGSAGGLQMFVLAKL